MKTLFAPAAIAALLLVGCAAEDTPPEVETTDVVKEIVEETVSNDAGLCLASGPQTPRDISSTIGSNPITFGVAPPSTEMNLCNIHTHTNAEHKGPGFSTFVNATDYGGYACNGTADLTEAELAPAPGKYEKVKPGDTIEVHWVHTSCDNAVPGPTLGACVTCDDPFLRVETQVFLVVNDENALNFVDMAYGGHMVNDLHQPKMIPSDTGEPVQFLGSTTGPSYDQSTCSPAQVTWSVRPQCAKLDINSLHTWAEGNVFEETKSHGVRQLVTAPELLSTIQ